MKINIGNYITFSALQKEVVRDYGYKVTVNKPYRIERFHPHSDDELFAFRDDLNDECWVATNECSVTALFLHEVYED